MADTYVTRPGDQWDLIAKRIYGAEKHADFLMAQNLPFLDVFEFDAGTVLKTPPLPESEEKTLPAWRRSPE